MIAGPASQCRSPRSRAATRRFASKSGQSTMCGRNAISGRHPQARRYVLRMIPTPRGDNMPSLQTSSTFSRQMLARPMGTGGDRDRNGPLLLERPVRREEPRQHSGGRRSRSSLSDALICNGNQFAMAFHDPSQHFASHDPRSGSCFTKAPGRHCYASRRRDKSTTPAPEGRRAGRLHPVYKEATRRPNLTFSPIWRGSRQ